MSKFFNTAILATVAAGLILAATADGASARGVARTSAHALNAAIAAGQTHTSAGFSVAAYAPNGPLAIHGTPGSTGMDVGRPNLGPNFNSNVIHASNNVISTKPVVYVTGYRPQVRDSSGKLVNRLPSKERHITQCHGNICKNVT
jgi:hypothetical protein